MMLILCKFNSKPNRFLLVIHNIKRVLIKGIDADNISNKLLINLHFRLLLLCMNVKGIGGKNEVA